jgi:hypothetical protein
MVIDGGALEVFEQDHSSRFTTIERGKNCEIRIHSIPTNVEPWLTSIELCPAKNEQAGHEPLWDITSVVLGCMIPDMQSSLCQRSIDVVKSRYTASVTADAVLCNLKYFFE